MCQCVHGKRILIHDDAFMAHFSPEDLRSILLIRPMSFGTVDYFAGCVPNNNIFYQINLCVFSRIICTSLIRKHRRNLLFFSVISKPIGSLFRCCQIRSSLLESSFQLLKRVCVPRLGRDCDFLLFLLLLWAKPLFTKDGFLLNK
jgi:hypothetical protein